MNAPNVTHATHMNMQQKIELLLSILSNLKRHDVVSVADLAQQLNMEKADLRDQLENLLYVGVPPFGGGDLLPIELTADDMICITGDMPALSQPLRLSEEESQALALALRIAGFSYDDELVRKLTGAVTRDFDTSTLEQIMHISQASHNTAVFQVLSHALNKDQTVKIHHRNRLGENNTRTVDPHALYAEADAWYLGGFDHKSQQRRSFRIDRIMNAELIQSSDSNNTGRTLSIRKFTTGETPSSIDVDQLPYSCRISFATANAFQVSEWPGAKVRPSTEDVLEVDVPYANVNWIAHKVMTMHGQAEVLFPADVQEAVQAAVREKLIQLTSSDFAEK